MPTPSLSAVLLIAAGALVSGFLVSWVHFRLRTGTEFIPLSGHRAELLAMRRLYRRRLRAMRDVLLRHKSGEQQLRSQVRATESHQTTQARLLNAAQAEIAGLRERVAATAANLHEREAAMAVLRAREQSLAEELRAALEKIAGFESDHGLLRIERDELVARTQRLRALPSPDTASPASEAGSASTAAAVASRAGLADRDARIHDLECQLRDRDTRLSELESSLQTWKYRIAPIALHAKMQRDRAQRAASGAASPPPAARPPDDDLKRIRGIGRGLEKKLRAEGITQIAQLAGMSPAELANLAMRIGVAASRPQRDRWIEQARELRTNPYVRSMAG